MHDDSTVPDVTLSEIPGDGGAPRQTPPLPPPAEGFVDEAVRDRLWWIAGVLFRRKWLIVGFTFLTAVAAAFLSLQMPNWYRAEARVLLPESSGGLSGLLDAVAPGAGAILGRDGGSFTRYRAILSSRTTLEQIVDQSISSMSTKRKKSPSPTTPPCASSPRIQGSRSVWTTTTSGCRSWTATPTARR